VPDESEARPRRPGMSAETAQPPTSRTGKWGGRVRKAYGTIGVPQQPAQRLAAASLLALLLTLDKIVNEQFRSMPALSHESAVLVISILSRLTDHRQSLGEDSEPHIQCLVFHGTNPAARRCKKSPAAEGGAGQAFG
jgi:hypothetical protein